MRAKRALVNTALLNLISITEFLKSYFKGK